MWRRLVLSGLLQCSMDERSSSLLLDCCTNGLVGGRKTKLDECDCNDGARPRSVGLLFSIVGPCWSTTRGSLREGLGSGEIAVYQGDEGKVPEKRLGLIVSSRL